MKDALGHGSDAHGPGIAKALDVGAAHQKMLHVVTAYDRRQEAKAQKNPKAYYNQYALPQYLGAVSRVHDEMKAGKPAAEAINNHMNGALARSVHKALGGIFGRQRQRNGKWQKTHKVTAATDGADQSPPSRARSRGAATRRSRPHWHGSRQRAAIQIIRWALSLRRSVAGASQSLAIPLRLPSFRAARSRQRLQFTTAWPLSDMAAPRTGPGSKLRSRPNTRGAKARIKLLEAVNAEHSAVLNAFPKGLMGMTPDHVKATPEFRVAKSNFNKSFAALRAHNSEFVKRFKKEIQTERNKRYAR
jgi:hypothetical protein